MADMNRTQAMGAPPVADPNRTIMGSPLSLNVTATIKPVQCPVCRSSNPPGLKFCMECGLIFEMALPEDAFNRVVLGDPANAARTEIMKPVPEERQQAYLALWQELKAGMR